MANCVIQRYLVTVSEEDSLPINDACLIKASSGIWMGYDLHLASKVKTKRNTKC